MSSYFADKRNSTGNLYFTDAMDDGSGGLRSNGRVGSHHSVHGDGLGGRGGDEINTHMVSAEIQV